jgi:hypothetical protein
VSEGRGYWSLFWSTPVEVLLFYVRHDGCLSLAEIAL